MTSNFSEHTNANYFIHTGHGQQGRPSMGAWATYGLGSECQNLPGFVVLDSGLIPPGGLDCFSNGFLPATFQGSVFQHGPEPVAYLQPREAQAGRQKQKLALLQLDDADCGIRSMRIRLLLSPTTVPFRMQTAVPGALDLSGNRRYQTDVRVDSTCPTHLFAAVSAGPTTGERGVLVEYSVQRGSTAGTSSDLIGGHTRNARPRISPRPLCSKT